jgi:hypothetical protein
MQRSTFSLSVYSFCMLSVKIGKYINRVEFEKKKNLPTVTCNDTIAIKNEK